MCVSGSLEGLLSAGGCGGVFVADKAGFKGSCCFFRRAKGPLNPTLYPAAAMLHTAASQCVFSRKVYDPKATGGGAQ